MASVVCGTREKEKEKKLFLSRFACLEEQLQVAASGSDVRGHRGRSRSHAELHVQPHGP